MSCVTLQPKVYAVAFNPIDDSMVAFAANDGTVHVYELGARSSASSAPASKLRVIKHSDRSTKVRLSPRVRCVIVSLLKPAHPWAETPSLSCAFH